MADIFEQIKKVYYQLEDKYYDVLDRINQAVPIYKVIDQIDQHVPSFLVLLLLFFLLLLLLIMGPLLGILAPAGPGPTPGVPTAYGSGFLVEDEQGVPVPGVEVEVVCLENAKCLVSDQDLLRAGGAYVSDERGEVNINIAQQKGPVEASFGKDGFEFKGAQKYTLQAQDKILIRMTRTAAALQPRATLFTVVDGSRQNAEINDKEIRFRFYCSDSPDPPERIKSLEETWPFRYPHPSNCGLLSVRVTAEGYQPSETRQVSGGPEIIVLYPRAQQEAFGALKVTVIDDAGDKVEGAIVKAFNAKLETLARQGETGVKGETLLPDLPPGEYFVTVETLEGNFKTEKGVHIQSQHTSEITIRMDPFVGGKKLFFRVTDKDTSLPLEGVQAYIYRGDTPSSEPVLTDVDGQVEMPINANQLDIEYRVQLIFEGYLTQTYALEVKDTTDIDAQELEMEKELEEPPITVEPGSIDVRVLSHTGGTVADATVVVQDAANAVLGTETTGASGAASFSNLAPGNYKLLATLEDGRSRTLENVRVNPNSTTQVDLQFSVGPETPKHKVFFRTVRADDPNLPVGAVSATIYMDVYFRGEFTTDESGEFSAIVHSQDKDKTFSVQVEKEGFIPQRFQVPVKDFGDTQPSLLPMQTTDAPPAEKTGSVEVLVENHLSQPEEGTRVRLFAPGNDLDFEGTTNANGITPFPSVPVGTYTVLAIADDQRIAIAENVVVEENQQTDVILVLDAADPTHKLFVQVRRSDTGAPIGGAGVAFSLDGSAVIEDTTNVQGEYTLTVHAQYAGRQFAVIASKDGFLTDIFTVPVQLVSSTAPTVLSLRRAPAGDCVSQDACGSVTIRVTDLSSGEPVAGAEVLLYDADNPGTPINTNPLADILTGPGGTKLFEKVPTGSYFARAQKLGVSGTSSTKNLAGGSSIELPISLNLPAAPTTGNLEVQVLSEGSPVDGAQVTLLYGDGAPRTSAQTGASGTVFFADLPTGVYGVAAVLGERTDSQDDILVAAGETEAVTLSIPPPSQLDFMLSFEVLDASNLLPVPNTRALIGKAGFPNLFARTTDGDGRVTHLVSLEDAAEAWYVELFADGYIRSPPHFLTVFDAGDNLRDTLFLEPIPPPADGEGGIEVTVVEDSDNSPIAGAEVRVFTPEGARVRSAETDADGKTVFPNLSTGRYEVTATKGQRTASHNSVIVRKDEVTLVVIPLPAVEAPPQFKLFFELRDEETDDPVPFAGVRILDQQGRVQWDFVSNHDGVVTLEVHSSQQFELFRAHVTHDFYNDATLDLFVKDADDPNPQVFLLSVKRDPTPETGALKVRVEEPDGAAAEGVSVTLSRTFAIEQETAITPASGEVEFTGLPVGGYNVTARATDNRTAVRENVQVAVGTTNLTLTLPESAAIEHKVFLRTTDADTTNPVQDAVVDVLFSGGAGEPFLPFDQGTTPASGELSFDVHGNDAQKLFMARVVHADYVTTFQALTVKADTDTSPDAIALEPVPLAGCDGSATCGVVDVHVSYADGTDVSGASVWLVDEIFGVNVPGDDGEPLLTDALGMATFEQIAPGSYSAVAEKDNVRAKSAASGLLAGDTLLLEVALPLEDEILGTGSIDVTVEELPGNAAVSGATVRLLSPHGETLEEQTTPANGEVSFNNLQAGTYGVIAVLDERSAKRDGVVVEADAATPVTLVLPEAQAPEEAKKLFFKIIEKGTNPPAPVANADAEVWMGEPPAKLLASLTTDPDGMAAHTLHSDNAFESFTLHVRAQGFVEGVFSVIPLPADSENPFVFALARKETDIGGNPTNYGSVRVTVVDGQGAPVNAALVSLFSPEVAGSFNSAGGEPRETDIDGTVTFSDLAPGHYYAVGRKDDTSGESATGELIAGTTLELEIVLHQTDPLCTTACGTVSVEVVDTDGLAVEGAEVLLLEQGPPQVPWNSEAVLTDADGRVTFTGVQAGKSYRASAQKETLSGESLDARLLVDGGHLVIQVVIEDTSTDPCATGPCGTLNVHVVDADGANVNGAQVDLFTLVAGQDPLYYSDPDDPKATDAQGMVQFEALPPGTYFAKARLGLRTGESATVELDEGETENLEIELITPLCTGDCGSVLVLVRSQGTLNLPLEGARVLLYKTDAVEPQVPFASGISDADGKVRFGPVPTGTYKAKGFLNQASGVSQEERELLAGGGEITLTVLIPETIDPCTVQACGTVEVHVVNAAGHDVPGAQVSLFYQFGEDFLKVNLPDGTPNVTDQDGLFMLEKQRIGVYKAEVEKDNHAATAGPEELPAGGILRLTAHLETGTGTLNVTVRDASTGAFLQGATVVLQHADTGEVLDTCTTDTDGACTLTGPAGASAFVHVSQDGFFPALQGRDGGDIPISIGDAVNIEVSLLPENEVPIPANDILFRYEKLCTDWACEQPVDTVTSSASQPKLYYALFTLFLKADESEEVMAHLRTMQDADTPVPDTDYKMRIRDVRSPGGVSASFSKCVDPSDPYKEGGDLDCQSGRGDASKQANLAWGTQSRVAIPVTLEVEVEEGLTLGEELLIHYTAKAERNGVQVTDPLETKSFAIGGLFCPDNELVWSFALREVGSTEEPQELAPGNTAPVELLVGTSYRLAYRVTNCLAEDLEGSTLSFNTEPLDEEDILSFPNFPGAPPHVILDNISPFGNNDTVTDEPLLFTPDFDVEFVDIVFSLTDNNDLVHEDAEARLTFSASTDRAIDVIGLPVDLPALNEIHLEGQLLNPEDNLPIAGATVEVCLKGSADAVDCELLGTVTTDDQGFFTFTHDMGRELINGEVVEVRVKKRGFKDAVTDIPVRPKSVFPAPEYNCIDVEGGGIALQEALPIPLAPGESTAIPLSTADCSEDVHVTLESPLTLDKRSLTIPPNGTDSFRVTAESEGALQGLHPVWVNARFESQRSSRTISEVRIAITDPNSCFALDPYEYDLLDGTAQGTFTNNCFFAHRDPRVPQLSLDTREVDISRANPPPSDITFTYTLTTRGTPIYTGGGGGSPVQNAINQSATIPTVLEDNTNPVTTLGSFDPADHIGALRTASGFSQAEFKDVTFTVATDDASVEAWIQGNLVKARYTGPEKTSGTYPFTLTNKSLKATTYQTATILDYITTQ